jgi:hypothetical protein
MDERWLNEGSYPICALKTFNYKKSVQWPKKKSGAYLAVSFFAFLDLHSYLISTSLSQINSLKIKQT